MMMLTKPDILFPVLVYDGECAFCSQTVKMILKADQKKTIRFAAGHSEFAKELLSLLGAGWDAGGISTLSSIVHAPDLSGVQECGDRALDRC